MTKPLKFDWPPKKGSFKKAKEDFLNETDFFKEDEKKAKTKPKKKK